MNDKQELALLLELKQQRKDENKLFNSYFQDDTIGCIENYAKSFKFYSDGEFTRQRCFIAGNRVGKTETAAYEIACHAIGWYPDWWQGKRYEQGKNLLIWCAGDTNKTIRDILQVKLLGRDGIDGRGKGILPKKYLTQKPSRAGGAAELVDSIYVDRIGGGKTIIQLKSYQGGRETFQGTEVDIVWLDEEPPLDIYSECLLRTMTNKGILLMTFTPLRGMTELISEFYKSAEKNPNAVTVTTATWDDVPHLDDATKQEMLASIPEWQRDARSKGIPQLGSGAIYRVSLDDVLVKPFAIPDHWLKCYALDVGWNRTAALWLAINPDNGCLYAYDELYVTNKQPHEYAREIKYRGDWINGVVDSASNNSNQHDGIKIFDLLLKEGLKLQLTTKDDKSVEAGIYTVWDALSNNKLKIFNTLTNLTDEYKIYRRDDKGHIVKEKDHLMDCLRYGVMAHNRIAKNEKVVKNENKPHKNINKNTSSNGWMG